MYVPDLTKNGVLPAFFLLPSFFAQMSAIKMAFKSTLNV